MSPASTTSRHTGPTWRLDISLMASLACLALLVRWPNLWLVPRFTDETLEVLHSLAIVRENARPLTNYDSYYGALYNYIVAVALAVSGESPLAPRFVVLVAGVATVCVTYVLGTEIGRRLDTHTGSRVPSRLVGLLAAGLLATNGPHVVVNSHVAWSNCLTPLLTTLAFWSILRWDRLSPSPAHRDVEARPRTYRASHDIEADIRVAQRRGLGGEGRLMLPLAGLLLGLALQTHPLVAAMLPGIALAVTLRDWRVLKSPWPWLAAVMFLVGYANVLVYNAEHGFESIRSAQRMQAEYAQDQQAASGYVSTAGSMLVLLARILGGAVDQRESVSAYLADPGALIVTVTGIVGLAMLACRRTLLPLLVTATFLLILPAVNSKFQTLLTVRYLMPIVPMLVACAALAMVQSAELAARRWPGERRRSLLMALLVGLVLSALPTFALDRYYQRIAERTDTNARILKLVAEVEAARLPDERLVVDDSIGAELPDTGVTELRGLEYLLTFSRVPYSSIRPSTGRLQDSLDGQQSVLAILNARDASAAAGRLRVESLDPRPPVETGRMFDFRIYRLSRDRA